LTRMWVSREFGGEQAGLRAGLAAITALARLDASAAWLIGVQGAIGRLSDYLPEESARRLFQENDGLVIGGVKPAGRAEQVDGGFLLEGEWSLASGSAHAGWLVCTAYVTENGRPVVTETGPEMRALFIPRELAEIQDTWYPVGLRGTGSNHYTVARTFVPTELTVSRAVMGSPPPERAARAYGLSYYDFGPFSTAPVALGLADAALDAFKELALEKTPTSARTRLGDNPTTQEKLARAEMLVYSARLLFDDAARQAVEAGTSGDETLSALIRLTAATLSEQTVAAVDSVFTLAGSSSVYASSPLERCFRDIHAATKHISLSSSHFETVGQYLLGGGLQMRR
jgi:indole-3-acetate monooxygenase